jgi:hypothetical protein
VKKERENCHIKQIFIDLSIKTAYTNYQCRALAKKSAKSGSIGEIFNYPSEIAV